MRRKTGFLLLFGLIATAFIGCSDNGNDEPSLSGENLGKGYYILCEGLMGRNNSSLDFYDTEKNETTFDVFLEKNAVGLGETANDMIEHGGKLYIAVTGSNCIMVVNKNTGEKTRQIILNTGDNPQPRQLAFYGNSLYVACFDGTVCKINPDNGRIECHASTQGRNPDGIAIVNDKVYVSNSGGLDYPNYDNTISVLNSSDLGFVKKIDVGSNPGILRAYNDRIIALVRGNYADIPCQILKINTNNDQIEDRVNVSLSSYDISGDKIIYCNTDYSSGTNVYKTLDINNLQAAPENFIRSIPNNVSIQLPYRISCTEANVFITDAKDYSSNGECFVFDTEGNFINRFATSTNPTTVISKQ